MKSRQLIDNIFEAEEAAAPAKPGSGDATVKIELTGSPKQIQKAIKQLAKEKPAGVKIKKDGENVSAEGDTKSDGDKAPAKKDDSKKPAFGKDKAPAKKDEPKDEDDDKDSDSDDKE
jgi:hypothetical protein